MDRPSGFSGAAGGKSIGLALAEWMNCHEQALLPLLRSAVGSGIPKTQGKPAHRPSFARRVESSHDAKGTPITGSNRRLFKALNCWSHSCTEAFSPACCRTWG